MIMSLESSELLSYLLRQVRTFFPDGREVPACEVRKHFDTALERVEYCFSKVNNKYFSYDGNVLFNHLNADHYAMFLYFAANTLHRNSQNPEFCTKLFLLNRYLHGVDAFYEVGLPDIFLFVHPVGTVMGRAAYSDYLLIYQRCGIGSNRGKNPTLGKYLSLHPGASVLGDCVIGDNCKISTGSLIMDSNLEGNSVYIGNTINSLIKKSVKIPDIWK